MELYLVVGNPSTRRASVIRSLSGCFNRGLRDILPLAPASRPLRVYVRPGALQETRTSAAEFVAEATKTRADAVLCALAASASTAQDFPDAQAYLQAFIAAGWRLRAVAVLGQNAGGIVVKPPRLRQFPQAPTAPMNVTAREVRALFGWL